MTNVFAITDRVSEGMPAEEHNRRVKLQVGSSTHVIGFSDARGWPQCHRGLMMAASPNYRGGASFFTGRGPWNGAIVFIEASLLDLGKMRHIMLHDVNNLWVGAEVNGFPFAQLGRHTDPEKVQILALESGERAFLIDAQKRCTTIVCRKGELSFVGPSTHGFAKAIADRALELHVNTHAAMTWTKHTLRALRQPGCWTTAHDEKLRRLGR